MSDKKLLFVIVAEQGYIHPSSENGFCPPQNELFFNAVCNTYQPLLDMLYRLEDDKVQFKFAMVLSPVLCELLEKTVIQDLYIDYLNRRIDFGNRELERNKKNKEIQKIIKDTIESLEEKKDAFTQKYSKRLIPHIRHFVEREMIEVIPTAATYAYLPHYSDLQEALCAQIETGLYANRVYFGESGEGFYLPYMGWAQNFDKVLRSYGINYTLLDTRALLFSERPPEKGIFAPVRTPSSLVVFGRDHTLPGKIIQEDGISHNPVYRNELRDVGFDLDASELQQFLGQSSIRMQTGYKYWANGIEEDAPIYQADKAINQAKIDAQAFFEEKSALLDEAAKQMNGEEAVLVCTLPASVLGQEWHEGLLWFENIIRLAAEKKEMDLSYPKLHISKQFSLPKLVPYPSSNTGSGYAENLLDASNNWMLRYVRKATERMISLADRFPGETGLKARLLNLGTKEVLLAQSSSWAKMLQEGVTPEYAAQEFKKNILTFSMVFDALASNTVSTEWLTKMEKEDGIFSWINYRIFSKKK
ncbi:MAG: DUF1957 domain-containing protein [Treponema sp.]|nr:DUF1957 domain-containing protein [Treponema sp.]